jgi:hypothetical protein
MSRSAHPLARGWHSVPALAADVDPAPPDHLTATAEQHPLVRTVNQRPRHGALSAMIAGVGRRVVEHAQPRAPSAR